MSKLQHAIYVVIIGAMAVVIVGLIAPQPFDDSIRAENPRIVVFPFVSMNSSVDELAEELTEALVQYLESTPGVEVVSVTELPPGMRNSGNHHLWPKDGSISLAVEGAVNRRGEYVQTTVQLLDGMSDTHLWAEAYESDAGDIRAILDTVEQQILAQISP